MQTQEVTITQISPPEFKSVLIEAFREALQEINQSANDRQTDPQKPLRLPEAAEYLGIAKQTMYGYVSKGLIKPHKPGKHNLFYKDELDAFIRGERPERSDGSPFLKHNKKARI